MSEWQVTDFFLLHSRKTKKSGRADRAVESFSLQMTGCQVEDCLKAPKKKVKITDEKKLTKTEILMDGRVIKKESDPFYLFLFSLSNGVGLLMPYPPHANLTTVHPLFVFARIRQA